MKLMEFLNIVEKYGDKLYQERYIFNLYENAVESDSFPDTVFIVKGHASNYSDTIFVLSYAALGDDNNTEYPILSKADISILLDDDVNITPYNSFIPYAVDINTIDKSSEALKCIPNILFRHYSRINDENNSPKSIILTIDGMKFTFYTAKYLKDVNENYRKIYHLKEYTDIKYNDNHIRVICESTNKYRRGALKHIRSHIQNTLFNIIRDSNIKYRYIKRVNPYK